MTFLLFTQILAIAAVVFSLSAFAFRLRKFTQLAVPRDRSPLKGDPQAGINYALTLGMLPWAKESTRRHAVAYLRGVGFHLVVFLVLFLFLASPWLGSIPGAFRTILTIICCIGSILALWGFLARFIDHGLKVLSTPDDYFAVILVSIFLASAAAMLVDSAFLPFFYLASALTFIYMPLGKIRHCIYFAFSRIFFGRFFGRRAVLPHNQQNKVTA